MKKSLIVLIVLGSVILLTLGTVLALSQIEKDTFIVKMDLEGVNSFPPRLTVLRDRGIVEETQLLSIFSGRSVPKLSITPSATTISGSVTLICKDYEDEKLFILESNIVGEGMEQRIVFKGLPRDASCIASAVTVSCETDQTRCQGGNLYLRFRTPK